jgi:hypothetical protein
MAKKGSTDTTRLSTDNALSLFDRENLESLDALRYELLRASATTTASLPENNLSSLQTETSDADRIFDQYKIDDGDESWGMGELNVKVVDRGRIKISRTQWQQMVSTCGDGFTESGIRKDFHLNVLQHLSTVRLIYISYRYKQSGDKQREYRRGILVDEHSNVYELMMRLAYWFTAQPHADKNLAVWKKLVDEAMTKLERTNPSQA